METFGSATRSSVKLKSLCTLYLVAQMFWHSRSVPSEERATDIVVLGRLWKNPLNALLLHACACIPFLSGYMQQASLVSHRT
jgi:hypothetical protein